MLIPGLCKSQDRTHLVCFSSGAANHLFTNIVMVSLLYSVYYMYISDRDRYISDRDRYVTAYIQEFITLVIYYTAN